MRIETDVSAIQRPIQDVERDRGESQAERLSKDSLEISKENVVASRVRLEDAEAALGLLKEVQVQIAAQPGMALLAQANIVTTNVTGLVE